MNENFSRKIKQIGEISYNPDYKNEEMRHLKVCSSKFLNFNFCLFLEITKLNYHRTITDGYSQS